ncbi:NTP transferase domain-containing protein [Sphingobium sp. CR2-8]|uniref:NTP transferase domain-containing protein n=1 Tax=Sphingobium sp. CR2-8 TaxID=1306534 RepID=UPI002DBFD10E|nr:NTP transferase domain-containing protein [Sphingobium sp. CR2-8]MEC3910000.1 NTP transferase domain-containing protein [Sphingobium sp. CR2-8]
MRSGRTTAILLAGRRDGTTDPLAMAAGVTHKCLVPVAGQPMLLHVIDALVANRRIGEIRVVIEDPALLAYMPSLRGLLHSGRLIGVAARPNLVDSIMAGADGAAFPLLITTADNVMLTPDTVDEMLDGCAIQAADAAVAFTRRASVLAAHPQGQRKFYSFADDAYSNCNTYWLRDRAALKAAEAFRSGGQFVKHPGRIVGAFGLVNLIRFRFGIGTLDEAFTRFSRRFRLTISPVILTDGAVAIDVDNDRSHGIATTLLDQRLSLAQAAE